MEGELAERIPGRLNLEAVNAFELIAESDGVYRARAYVFDGAFLIDIRYEGILRFIEIAARARREVFGDDGMEFLPFVPLITPKGWTFFNRTIDVSKFDSIYTRKSPWRNGLQWMRGERGGKSVFFPVTDAMFARYFKDKVVVID